MKKAGKTHEPMTYEYAGHSFMRAGEAPDAQSAQSEGAFCQPSCVLDLGALIYERLAVRSGL